VILGTAARPDILRASCRARASIAAVDSRDGEVVVKAGNAERSSRCSTAVRELRPYVGGFLVTFVETRARCAELTWRKAKAVIEAAGDVRVTLAGGIRIG
jgi:phosphoribosylformimino-5-aminoimidazole carboxamide ribonucleotide (ProFAR) isomerase